MRKTLWKVGLSTAAVVLFSSSAAYAQPATATASLNVTVNVASRARLTLSTAGITFADADPDVVATLTAGPVDVNVGARTAPTSNVTLTVLATGNLISGSDVITIDQLTWTVGGPSVGFVAGTSNATVAQSVGSWTGPGTRNGSQSFALPNSWNYAPGSYSTTLNYTLSVP